jgi:hypothetical protein
MKGGDHLEYTRGRWKYNIKIYFEEILWEGVDWIHLSQIRDR